MISWRDPNTGKTLSVGTMPFDPLADPAHGWMGRLCDASGRTVWHCDHRHANQQGIEDSALQCAKNHLKQLHR